jgi:hypothetical protein
VSELKGTRLFHRAAGAYANDAVMDNPNAGFWPAQFKNSEVQAWYTNAAAKKLENFK